MKSSFAFATCLSVSILSLSAFASKEVGNGGDLVAMEFVTAARQAERYIETSSPSFNVQLLKNAIETTHVDSSDDRLSLMGAPKDALNFPDEKRIVFSRKRWSTMTDSERAALSVHEYLGIIRLNDSSYQISSDLLRDLKYQNSAVVLTGQTMVNFAKDNQYLLKARITIESFGPQSPTYSAGEENIRVTIEADGQRKVYVLPQTGHVLFAHNDTGFEDAGVYFRVLQPRLNSNQEPVKRSSKDDMSIYVQHEVRDYRIEWSSRAKKGMPETMQSLGPISNQAG